MLEQTIGRLLVFPAYTVAAINGHAFAGGALISCAFDYRVMREDRGYWCMNEAEIGLALDERLWSILTNRLPRATATVAATTARRFSGPDALAFGIVEAVAGENDVLGERARHGRAHVDTRSRDVGSRTSDSRTVRRPSSWASCSDASFVEKLFSLAVARRCRSVSLNREYRRLSQLLVEREA